MSVLMVMPVQVEPSRFEEMAANNRDTMKAISERGKQAGAIHHHFYAGDGKVIIVDEWDSAESFQSFFESETEIPQLMAEAGVQESPEPRFYTAVDVGDEF
jgi:heme-degrading monooxygenase HmoA